MANNVEYYIQLLKEQKEYINMIIGFNNKLERRVNCLSKSLICARTILFKLVKRVDLIENEIRVDYEHEVFFFQVEDQVFDQMMENEPPLEIEPLLENESPLENEVLLENESPLENEVLLENESPLEN